LRATPGIAAAGAASTMPLIRGWNLGITVEGHPEMSEGAAEYRAASVGYFQMMGIRRIAGRDILPTDVPGSPGVVIISESFAKKYWPNESAIGKRIFVGRFRG